MDAFLNVLEAIVLFACLGPIFLALALAWKRLRAGQHRLTRDRRRVPPEHTDWVPK
jgi:hypothetical protein